MLALVAWPAEPGGGAGAGSWAGGTAARAAGWLSWRLWGRRGQPGRKGYGCVQEQGACVGRGQTPYIPEGQGHLGDWRGAHPGVCAGEPLAVLTRTARETEGKMPT